jgi:hypothetical protein
LDRIVLLCAQRYFKSSRAEQGVAGAAIVLEKPGMVCAAQTAIEPDKGHDWSKTVAGLYNCGRIAFVRSQQSLNW